MGASLGAEITGVDLSDISAKQMAEIADVFEHSSVIVFRDQSLCARDQIAFTRYFGSVECHPLYRSAQIEGYPEILVLDHKDGHYINGRNNVWHADVTFAKEPPLGSVLYCKAVKTGFGDTLFCSMRQAYQALSKTLQSVLCGLSADHSARAMVALNNSRDYNVAIPDVPRPVSHPVVRTNPKTNQKSLFVNPIYTTGFTGMSEAESRPLLEYLYGVATRAEHIYRHRWRIGDVVMFDNRCTMHYVVPDYGPEIHRLMHRTTAAGGVPQ